MFIIVLKTIYFFSLFIILWGMIGYPISLKLLKTIYKNRTNKKNYRYKPTVTIMVVAHNEEKVIKNKLENILKLEYDIDKLDILVTSDNSTDNTNNIVNKFILENSNYNIRLYKVKDRKGKTNAQNEAVKTVKSEILVMTDANSMFEKNALSELLSSFTNDNIAYVTGRLCYINKKSNNTNISENTYWNIDLKMREIESKIQTITAGNGAIYACRTKDYYNFNPIECHDSSMPIYYALQGKRAIFNKDAIAYEKTGDNINDEFKRKVRMFRIILKSILPNIKILNFIKYKWFTYFYLGHRTCRYLLWISHILLFICNVILFKNSEFYTLTLLLQLIFYILAIINHFSKNKIKILTIPYYYCMTILAQIIGVKNILTGKSKPFWEKVENTR